MNSGHDERTGLLGLKIRRMLTHTLFLKCSSSLKSVLNEANTCVYHDSKMYDTSVDEKQILTALKNQTNYETYQS